MSDIGSTACPWLGLRSYGPEDASRFHGRRSLIAAVDLQLRSKGTSGVVGSSGSGKSSVLGAGLASLGWTPILCRVTVDPLEALTEAESRSKALGPDDRAVLVVDQMEEVFAVEDDQVRSDFFDRLVSLAGGESSIPIAFALRSDRYGDCAAYPEFAEVFARNHVLVPTPSEEDLTEMILGPARRAGLEVAPAITAAILDDIDGEPGALPLLSHALASAWQECGSERIELEHYEACGGIHGSIAATGESVWSSLTPEQAIAARRILTELVDPLSPNLDISRKLRPSEVLAEGTEQTELALERLVAGRLVVRDGGWIEIAHEAVFREWPRLRAWLEEDQSGLRVLGTLSAESRRWAAEGNDPDSLLTGVRLESGLEVAQRWPDRIPPSSRTYLDASVERRTADEAALLDRLKRQRRMNRVLRGAVAAAVALAVGVGVFAYVANRARDTAESARTIADARRLAALSGSLRADQLDLAALLAVESSRRSDEVTTRGALLASIVTRPELREYAQQGIEAGDATMLDGSKIVAFGAGEGSVELADTATSPATRISRIKLRPDDVAVRIRFLSAERVAIADDGDHIGMYEVATGKQVRTAEVLDQPRVLSMEVSLDGTTLVVGDVDGNISLYDTTTLERKGRFAVADSEITALAVHPNGTDVIVASLEPMLSTWQMSDGSQRGEQYPLQGETTSVAFDPSGSRLAIGSDQNVEIVDAVSLNPLVEPFDAHGGLVYSLQWLEDGAVLMSAGEDGTVAFWEPSSGRASRRALMGHTASILAATVATDEDVMLTSSSDGRVAIWSLAGRGPAARSLPAVGEMTSVAVAADGSMVTGTVDGKLQRRDADGTLIGEAVTVGEGRIADVVVTPDGSTVGAVLWGGSARVYRGKELRPVSPELKIGIFSSRASLSEDGRWFAVSQADAGCDPCVHVFDLQSTAPDLDRVLSGSAGSETGGFGSRGVELSADGEQLYSISQAGDVEAFTRSTGASIWKINLEAPARSIAQSADGSQLAVGATGGQLLILDAASGRRLQVLRGHRGRVGSLAFRPDGRGLASISLEDRTMRIWDLETGLTIGEPIYIGLDDYVQHAWLPSGDRVLVPHQNGTVMEYDLRVDQLRSAACALAGRDLSTFEWEQYVATGTPRRGCS